MRHPSSCCCDDPTCPTCATSPGWDAATAMEYMAYLDGIEREANAEAARERAAVVVADEGGGTAEYPF
jgi:hypothetical protein